MMRIFAKAAISIAVSIIAIASIAAIAAVKLAAPHARELGRSDPKRAAYYRLPWFNFAETYTDGAALGVSIGSTKLEAINAAERAGLVVEPGGWGDHRAGQADLYQRPALVDAMLRQPYLDFHEPKGKTAMTVNFGNDRVVAIRIYYINSGI
jgi:hypothetical protein